LDIAIVLCLCKAKNLVIALVLSIFFNEADAQNNQFISGVLVLYWYNAPTELFALFVKFHFIGIRHITVSVPSKQYADKAQTVSTFKVPRDEIFYLSKLIVYSLFFFGQLYFFYKFAENRNK